MTEEFVIGQKVQRSDITEDSIPAFKALRGIIVEVKNGRARIHWSCDSSPEFGSRDYTTIKLATSKDV